MRTWLTLGTGAVLAILWATRPLEPCPCEALELPAELDGRAGVDAPREAAALWQDLRPTALRLRRYGEAGTALRLHFHHLDGEHAAFAHSPEVCARFHGWTIVERWRLDLPDGATARGLRLARGRAHRLIHYAYRVAAGERVQGSPVAAWLAGLAQVVRGHAPGATLLILDSGDLSAAVADDDVEGDRRFVALLRAPR